MSTSSVERLRKRLALVAYFRHLFGVKRPHDPGSVKTFHEALNEVSEGEDAEGRSNVYLFVTSRAPLKAPARDPDTPVSQLLTPDQLRDYDRNVREHTSSLNEHRETPITFKPFQVLSALVAEAYLDRALGDPESFAADLNRFVRWQNDQHAGQVEYPAFTADDLRKAAFWMATGSGKTLLMHLNYYQYFHYVDEHHLELPDNILLITPNEGLSEQHLEEMQQSGIPCRRFHAQQASLLNARPEAVKVIEITKLAEEASTGGLSVEVDAFEGRNLLFVDEGHKGAGGEAWIERRKAIAQEGFTFEYSATFGYGLGNDKDLWEEYGKAILFDYSYPRFYDDGYGKAYHILNLENDVDPDLTDAYSLANVLKFYEQVHVFEQHPETLQTTYNIKRPLLIFIGDSVTAGKTANALLRTRYEERAISDVQRLLLFLQRVLADEDGWVGETIERILDGTAGLTTDDGEDLFADEFTQLRRSGLSGVEIARRLRQRVFHAEGQAQIELVNIKGADGEIGIRASTSNEYFAVINIGNDTGFLDIIEEQVPEIGIEADHFTDSLFHEVNQSGSPINVLLGSRKFIEGWSSWRVATMGLLNFGQTEGSQIIQLFGRGVRLLGKDQSLKRSEAMDEPVPEDIPISILETLNIFGIRADYMRKFRDYLAKEGIDVDPRETFKIETRQSSQFEGEGLLVVRSQSEVTFEDAVKVYLAEDGTIEPRVDLSADIHGYRGGEGGGPDVIASGEAPRNKLPKGSIGLLDWDDIYGNIWKFRAARGYENLVAEKKTLKDILEEELYDLRAYGHQLEIKSIEDLGQIQNVAEMILRKYIEEFYTRKRRWFERRHLAYHPLEAELERDQSNFIDAWEAEIKVTAPDLMQELQERLRDDTMWENEDGLPERIHFDKHLYLPLLVEAGDDPDVTYYPQGLNEGERDFLLRLREFAQQASTGLLDGWEMFVLQNQTRGRGIGFLVGEHHDARFYPDFIIWLKNDDHQHIVFLDPHGMVYEGHPEQSRKVGLHQGIKDYEQELSEKHGREDVSLHSYIISQTEFPDLSYTTQIGTLEEFHEYGVFFQEDPLYELFGDVLEA